MAANSGRVSSEEGDYIWGDRSSVLSNESSHQNASSKKQLPILPTHRTSMQQSRQPTGLPPADLRLERPAQITHPGPNSIQALQAAPTVPPPTMRITPSVDQQRPAVQVEHLSGGWAQRKSHASIPGRMPQLTVPAAQFQKWVNPQRKYLRRSRFARKVKFFSFICLIGFAGFLAYSWAQSQLAYAETSGQTIVLTVPEGATGDDISILLSEAEVVPSSTAYSWYLKLLHRDLSIQSGSYVVERQSSAGAVTKILEQGPNGNGSVVIPEGLWVDEILDSLAAQLPTVTRQSLEIALSNATFPTGFTPPEVVCPSAQPLCRWEGLLFPATYQFATDVTAEQVISEMTSGFEIAVAELDLVANAQAAGQDPYQVLVVASLIEGEAAIDEDRPKIAEVIYHRLSGAESDNAWLGIDATVIYSLGSRNPGDGVIVERHRDGTDPYNTSALGGSQTKQQLPPTPIGAAGRASISAALSPTANGYKWYTLPNPTTSAHTFSTNKADHDAADAQYDALVAAQN